MQAGGAHRTFWSTAAVFVGCWLGGLLFDWWLIVRLQGQQMGAAALAGQRVFRPEAPKNRDYPL